MLYIPSLTGARGSGRTTHAILQAPRGAVFVAPGISVRHFEIMTIALRRGDLFVRPISWATDDRWRGLLSSTNIVIDHEAVSILLRESPSTLDRMAQRFPLAATVDFVESGIPGSGVWTGVLN